ncbi:MAG: HAMP domain-containing histidine kinase [Elusimicrobia bacterium]|nr:HAMP domain-containing histidine kinase [Elusimicrobiota bacterium]
MEAPSTPHRKTEAAVRRPEPSKDQRLASYMTHELRAPLTSVRSALGMLEEQLDDRLQPDERQVLSLALKNADRLAGLINDILDFSKLQAGKMALERAPLEPQALIQEAVDSLQAWAIRKGVRLARGPSAGLPRVRGDARRLTQVLTNLISNAIKFTPAGGRVEVGARMGRAEHTGTIVFVVKDSGCGIPPEDVERIFQCFEQSALGAKTSEGTGLGLTLAKSMVELHGGRIWAESWRGLGSTFQFTIPIVAEDLGKPVEVYPKAPEYHGLLVDLFKRFNAVVAAFF